jgi:hypothetical protein
MRSLVTLVETAPDVHGDNQLILRPRPGAGDDIRECRSLLDVLEHELCNGWETVDPADIGAMTDGEIISQEITRDDDGEITALGRVYWFADYQVVDPIATLLDGSPVRLHGSK